MRGGDFVWLVFALATSCGDNVPPPDPGAPFHFELSASYADPRPPSDPPLAVYYDGVARPSLAIDFPTFADAIGATHRIELRRGDVVLIRIERTIGVRDGVEYCSGGDRNPLLQYKEAWCAYENGELRNEFVEGTGTEGGCSGDGFCSPPCLPVGGPNTCPAGQHCTSRIVSPVASHLGCAPVGAKQLGEACSLVADPDGAYDDCADGGICVGGTCERICNPRGPWPADCTSCSYIPGHAPEIGVCS